MKGKGKSKSGTKIKVEVVENDSLFNVPEFNAANTTREFHSFISAVQRKNVEDINLEDLRGVQFQLETVLISLTRRKQQVQHKVYELESLSAKKNKRSRSTDSVDKKTSEERPPKKSKESNSKAHSASTSQPKSKFIQTPYSDSHVEVPKVQKNDGPSRFWTFLEPYCTELTQDTIRAIEHWINPQDDNEKYKRIPELDDHFTFKWPLDDLKEEIKEGSKSVENNKGLFTDSADDQAEGERILNLGYNESVSASVRQYHSLIDRIVYSLVGENLMTSLDDTMTEVCNEDSTQNAKPNLSQSTSLTNNDSLEKRLLKGFCDLGMLESDETEAMGANDEVCKELKILQNALIPVHEYNTIQKRKLLALAKMEMGKQEVKKKLQELDAKVMEVYRMVSAARKNQTMSKKLEDQVKRTLRERKKLVERLKNMN